ncbi:SH2 domain-containing adapter protein D-like [Littorina saxatilis]|uniref:SH2 domain-containing adapter protein D-like n=1 Tax=Littorina saxatilis TaxID=31220 RepID=UPI0038B6B1A6
MDQYTEPKDAKRFVWGDPVASDGSGTHVNEEEEDHYSEPYKHIPESSNPAGKNTGKPGNDSQDVYQLAHAPGATKASSDYDVPPPPISANEYKCLNGGAQTKVANSNSVPKVVEHSDNYYSHISSRTDEKNEKPQIKTQKPNINNDKPQIKTEKPSIKTEKPNGKASTSSKNSTDSSTPRHSPAKSPTHSSPDDRMSKPTRQKAISPRKKSGDLQIATKASSPSGCNHNPSPPVYEEAWDTAQRQKQLAENLKLARSISTTSDKFEDALEYLQDDKAPMRQTHSGRKAGGKTTDPVSGGTYEEAWDLNRGLEEKLRSLQFMHPEPKAAGGVAADGGDDGNYQEPWDTAKKQRELEERIFQARTSGVPGNQKSPQHQQQRAQQHQRQQLPHSQQQQQVHQPRQHQEDVYEEAWDTQKRSLSQILQEGRSSPSGSTRSTHSVYCTIGEPVNAMIPLHNQDWYHGNISRDDAEQQLRVSKDGSYLVRDSSDRYHYTLSIKSPLQIIHIQIDQCKKADGTMRYILGKNSKAFQTIPAMIDHYTQHAMPIKGAEHMTLLHPIQCHWSQANDDTRL